MGCELVELKLMGPGVFKAVVTSGAGSIINSVYRYFSKAIRYKDDCTVRNIYMLRI